MRIWVGWLVVQSFGLTNCGMLIMAIGSGFAGVPEIWGGNHQRISFEVREQGLVWTEAVGPSLRNFLASANGMKDSEPILSCR